MRRWFSNNRHERVEVVFGPDAISTLQGNIGNVVNTFSPMSRGAPTQFQRGDHFTHKATGTFQPVAGVEWASQPVATPARATVGEQAGVFGSSALPKSSGDTLSATLAWMNASQTRQGW
jgi:hypothetical protein